jgi:hypothetical protein
MKPHAILFTLPLTLAACTEEPRFLGGPCDDFTGFTVPIVPVDSLTRTIPQGELNPPEDVIPAVAGGFGFNTPTVDVLAPGSVVVTRIESTEYLVSPGRQGVTDFGMTFWACDDIKVELAHVVTLDETLAAQLGEGHCEDSAGAEETTRDCFYDVDVQLAPGDVIGTTGQYQNGQGVGLDMVAVDLTYDIPWLNPERIGDIETYHHAMCPYVNFVPDIANAYMDHATSGLTPLTRDERCGVAAIDVAGTGQGIWVRADNPVTLAEDLLQDAPNFLTLSPGVADPDAEQLISSGVPALGRDLVSTTVESTGRVNLAFALLPDDGTIHCYEGVTPQNQERAHLIALTGDTLTVEPTTDCAADPSTWTFTGAAIDFIR